MPAETAKPLPHELEQLDASARDLGISEYELFQRAFEAWHGRRADPESIDHTFGRYLKEGELPEWVRHFCRQYLDAHPDCMVRREALAVRARRADWIAFALIVLAVLIALII
jgi:hypothetical protein